jgi:hypothetical protein
MMLRQSPECNRFRQQFRGLLGTSAAAFRRGSKRVLHGG